ncbi:MAG: sorbitol-6-phosphate dehydrogenase [Spirochaetes bacterium]|nr:MAG: sorbitol-6-phosphate dehydrogenase [Spirochaetota bacterium]
MPEGSPNIPFNIPWETAIVTGGGQGLGEAICHSLAQQGLKVTVADINEKNAEKVAGDLKKKYNVDTLSVKSDVTKEEDVVKMVEETVKKFGKLDVMVSNAGILISHEITEFPLEEFKRIIDVNLTGYFLCAREAARVMKKQGGGVIIQINSKSGKKGSYKNCAYSASKFGGIGLTQSIALDLAPYNIRVNAICPGNLLDSPLWVKSLFKQYAKKWGISEEEVRKKYIDQVPLKRGCRYEDVTSILLFLISDGASYMTGQAINVTGGQEMR